MTKGLNIQAKFIAENINTITAKVSCKDCGKESMVSVKRGLMPTCPSCAKKNGIDWKEVSKEVIGVDGYGSTGATMLLNDDVALELQYSEKMYKRMGMLNSKGTPVLDCPLRIFSCNDKIAITKEEAKEEKDRTAAILAARATAPRKPTARKKASSITDNDLDYLLNIIKTNFDGKFKNKDLAPLVAERFTARQTPSRLKRMVDEGKLQSDTASPKNYWLA